MTLPIICHVIVVSSVITSLCVTRQYLVCIISDYSFTVCVAAQGTIEMLLAGAICGFSYAVFSGQPLTIIGATGPLLVFESIVFQICELVDDTAA